MGKIIDNSECQCGGHKSFADCYFDSDGLTRTPLIRFGDDWEEPVREGDQVAVYHEGVRYRIYEHFGYWNSGIVGLYPEPLEAS